MRLPLFFSLLPVLMLQSTPPEGDPSSDSPSGDPPAPDPEPEDVSGLKSALEKERTKRKQYEADLKAARDAQTELDRLKADAQKKADEEAAEQGKFKDLLDKRDADLKIANDSLTTLQERLDEALAAITADVDSRWKDVPDEVRELYEGDDDDVLAKRKHLTRSAKLIARLTETKEPARGNGPGPKAGGPPKIDTKAEVAKTARRYRV